MAEDRAVVQRQPKMERIAKDVKDIADNFSCPISEVDQILSAEIHHLEQGAHIKEFVPILAIKRVKDRLREHHARATSRTTNQQKHTTDHAREYTPEFLLPGRKKFSKQGQNSPFHQRFGD